MGYPHEEQLRCYITVIRSLASRLCAQAFVQAQIKETIKGPRYWPSWGKSTGDRWFLFTKGQYCGKCFHSMTRLNDPKKKVLHLKQTVVMMATLCIQCRFLLFCHPHCEDQYLIFKIAFSDLIIFTSSFLYLYTVAWSLYGTCGCCTTEWIATSNSS